MGILRPNRKRWPVLVASCALVVAAACSDDDAGLDTVESRDTSSATDDADTSTTDEVADVDGETETAEDGEGGEAPSSPPPDGPLATVEGTSPDTELEITDLRRVGDSVTLEFVIAFEAEDQSITDVFAAPEDQYGADGVSPMVEDRDRRDSVSGVTLVDEANRNQHLVLRNEEGLCLCTSFEGSDVGRHVHSAQFSAPPEDVQDMTVQVPRFPAVDNVPLRTAG